MVGSLTFSFRVIDQVVMVVFISFNRKIACKLP
jgi:hypothetical protein